MIREKLADVLVVSLDADTERKQHVQQHFNECGLTDYRFIQAVPASSALVYAMYAKGRVKSFPECFRCFQPACECANNILIPQQVANWLSFKKVWEIVADAKGPVLVCEDDVYFYKNGLNLLDNALDGLLDNNAPQLIRLGHSGLTTETDLSGHTKLDISNDVVMSNVAHIITPVMARLLLTKFDYIDTTSDIWLHNWVAKHQGVKAHTVKPLIATDLSFNKAFAQFRSQIHPKGIDADDEERARQHIKRVGSSSEYSSWLAKLLGSSQASENAKQWSTFNQLTQSANPILVDGQREQVKTRNLPSLYQLVKSKLLPAQADIFTAQEGEDALLKRLLKWHYNNHGFYVDVGAYHPTRLSNTFFLNHPNRFAIYNFVLLEVQLLTVIHLSSPALLRLKASIVPAQLLFFHLFQPEKLTASLIYFSRLEALLPIFCVQHANEPHHLFLALTLQSVPNTHLVVALSIQALSQHNPTMFLTYHLLPFLNQFV